MGAKHAVIANSEKESSQRSRSWSTAFKKCDEKVVKLMQPVYYISSPIFEDELRLTKENWSTLSSNSNPEFIRLKQSLTTSEFPYESSKAYFLSSYFNRLFDIHPLSRPMFSDPWSQERFVVGIQAFMFSVLDDKNAFNEKLRLLAKNHCKKGVKAVEYGIIGEVWFWSMETCLGDLYTEACHLAWRKLFSSMLRIIVPVAMNYELRTNGEAQKNRSAIESASYSWKHMYTMKTDSDQRYLAANFKKSRIFPCTTESLSSKTSNNNSVSIFSKTDEEIVSDLSFVKHMNKLPSTRGSFVDGLDLAT